jgi:uncharacterized membrane protein YdbT with pleckstrin-like domain
MEICPMCGEGVDEREIRCTRCAVSTPASDSWQTLSAGDSLAYRLVRSVTMAAGGALAGAVALAIAVEVSDLLPLVISGSLLPLMQGIVILAGIFAAVIGFSAIFVSFAELQPNASVEISKDVLRFNDLQAEVEVGLAQVRCVRVDQGWFSRLFRYGAIEIFTDGSPEPAAIIPGVSRPHCFKEKLESILKDREASGAHGAT